MNEKRFKVRFEQLTSREVVDLLNEQQATITKLEQICEKKMQEIENIKYSLKEIAYKYHKEVQFKADTDPNQAVKEVLCEQQATLNKQKEEIINSHIAYVESLNEIKDLKEENEQLKNYFKKRAECSNFQINKLKEEIAELQEDNVDTIVELSKENEQLRKELKEIKENPINYF